MLLRSDVSWTASLKDGRIIFCFIGKEHKNSHKYNFLTYIVRVLLSDKVKVKDIK